MQLGIFARTFSRPTLEGVLDAVAGHGLDCVQFNFACAGLPALPEHIAPDLADKIRHEMEERKISVAALSGTFNLVHPDLRNRRDGLQRLAVLGSACRRLGTRIISLCTGTRDAHDMWRWHPDNDRPDAWKALLASLSEALAMADEHDLLLAVEPEVNNVIDSAAKARRLLDELKSPRLKIIMDPANLFRARDLPRMREVLDEAFELLAADIILAHAKDLGTGGQTGHEAAGTGVLDYDHYLRLLHESDFAGPLLLHGLAESQVKSCVAFLRGKLQSVTGSASIEI